MNSFFHQTDSDLDRILVVDDTPDNRLLLQVFLEGEGYDVEVAECGRTALDKIATNPPDLVLLDVMMPEMNGFEVTRAIRQNPSLPYIPILLITGYVEPLPADGLDVGADGFVRKPVDVDALLQRIRSILQPRPTLDPA